MLVDEPACSVGKLRAKVKAKKNELRLMHELQPLHSRIAAARARTAIVHLFVGYTPRADSSDYTALLDGNNIMALFNKVVSFPEPQLLHV